jgi:alpha-tubulin suppressor-like RCC1 family protein
VKTDGDEEYGTVPLLLASDESIEEVSCGALHTLVLSNKGRVFAAGMYNTRSNE